MKPISVFLLFILTVGCIRVDPIQRRDGIMDDIRLRDERERMERERIDHDRGHDERRR